MKEKLQINPINDKKVCIVGNLNIDLIIRNVPKLPSWGQEVLGNDYIQVSSGQSAYTAFALRQYQVPTSIIGNVGDDIYGEKILTDLKNSDLDISAIEKVKGGRTGITVAIVRTDGERAFVSDPSSLVKFDHALIERHADAVEAADIVCVVGIFFLPSLSVKDVGEVCKKARGIGKLTLLDTGWDPEDWQKTTIKDLRNILKHVDFFIPNMDEAKALTGFDSPEKAANTFIDDGCGLVIIKLGKKGSYLLSDKEEFYFPAHNVKVFDAVGAGDTFNAGFIYGTLQNWPLKARMMFGTATSALYISKPTDRFPVFTDSAKLANQNDVYEFIE